MTIVVSCDCGKTFRVKDELAGKRGKCSSCGQAILIPATSQPMEESKPSASSMPSCPECQQPMPPAAVICMNCGLDLRTGQRIPAAVKKEDVRPVEHSAKSSASSSRSRTRSRHAWIAVGVTTSLAALAVAAIYLVYGPKAPVAASRPGGESAQVGDAGAAPANANAAQAAAGQPARGALGLPQPQAANRAAGHPNPKRNPLDPPRVVLGMSNGSPVLFADLISGMTISLTAVKYDHNARIESYDAHISVGNAKPFVVRVGRKGSMPPGRPAEFVAAIDGKPIPLLDDSNVTGLLGIALKDFGGVVFPYIGSVQIPVMLSTNTYDENGRPQLATQEFTIDGMMYVISYSNHSRDENARASGYVVHVYAQPGNTPPVPPALPGGQSPLPMALAKPNQDNPLVAAKAMPKEPRPERIIRNAKALDGGSIDKWQTGFQSAVGDSVSRENCFLFLTDFNRLYDKNSFREAESAKLLDRMPLVPADQIAAWETSLTKSIGSNLIPPLPSRSATLVVIVQQDSLFQGAAFDSAASQALAERVASVPTSAISAVKEAAGQNSAMEDTDAVVAIAKYDQLFVGNIFQDSVWQQLLQNQGQAPTVPNPPNPAGRSAMGAPNSAFSLPPELTPKSRGTIIDIGSLPEYFYGRINRRKDKWDKTTSDKAVDDWRDAITTATGEQQDLATLVSFLWQFDPLWPNDMFQPAASERYAARIRRLPADQIVKWQSELNAVSNGSLTKVETVGYIISFDRLFTGEDLQPAESDHLLARVKSIPADVVKTWDAAVDGSPLQIVLGLANNDSLFDQQNGFIAPAAQQLLTTLHNRKDSVLKKSPSP